MIRGSAMMSVLVSLWGAKTSSRRPDVLVNDTAKTITSQNTSVT
jgi:hypothetical protein